MKKLTLIILTILCISLTSCKYKNLEEFTYLYQESNQSIIMRNSDQTLYSTEHSFEEARAGKNYKIAYEYINDKDFENFSTKHIEVTKEKNLDKTTDLIFKRTSFIDLYDDKLFEESKIKLSRDLSYDIIYLKEYEKLLITDVLNNQVENYFHSDILEAYIYLGADMPSWISGRYLKLPSLSDSSIYDILTSNSEELFIKEIIGIKETDSFTLNYSPAGFIDEDGEEGVISKIGEFENIKTLEMLSIAESGAFAKDSSGQIYYIDLTNFEICNIQIGGVYEVAYLNEFETVLTSDDFDYKFLNSCIYFELTE